MQTWNVKKLNFLQHNLNKKLFTFYSPCSYITCTTKPITASFIFSQNIIHLLDISYKCNLQLVVLGLELLLRDEGQPAVALRENRQPILVFFFFLRKLRCLNIWNDRNLRNLIISFHYLYFNGTIGNGFIFNEDNKAYCMGYLLI